MKQSSDQKNVIYLRPSQNDYKKLHLLKNRQNWLISAF